MTDYLHPASIEKSLNLERYGVPEKIEWLEKSWDKGSDFWSSLCRSHDNLFGHAGKSRPFMQYDFFHDLVIRNITRENPAFIWYDPVKKWQEISYQALGQRAEQISDCWQKSGVRPGDTLCIIKQFGPGYLLSLLAGLRTGVILSFIRPEGKTLIKKRLESLQPDYICTDNIYQPLLSEWQDKIIHEKGVSKKTGLIESSYTYSTGATAALCFDAASEDLITPKEVSSDLLYLSGIRDGLIGLEIKPGDIFAAPGFNDILTQPSFVLSVLFNGATYLHCSVKDIQKEPDLLSTYPLKTLGITSELRDILMESPIRKEWEFGSWFRSPTDSSDMHVWDAFIKELKLEDIPAGCMVWNAAMGGCILFSIKRKGQALQSVVPSPGRKWKLAMLEDNSSEALGGIGLFTINASLNNEEESYIPTPFILAETHHEKIFVSPNLDVRKGVHYPKKLVTEIVQNISSCKDSVVVQIPDVMNNGSSPGFHLLIFTGNILNFDPAAIIDDIHNTIRSEIGKNNDVDDIRFFPLFPRRTEDNKIDEDWCCMQYLTGGLKSKSKDDLFLNLSGLRARLF